jgi:hypothetical protein
MDMSPRAKRLARKLLRENRGTRKNPGRPWRVISQDDYNGAVHHATLCRIATSHGEWIPKDRHILIALGLIHERKKKSSQPSEPLTIPRIAHLLRQLGWLDETRIQL